MLGKLIVALITPFDSAGEVDLASFEKLLHWHVSEGTDGVVIGGSTGEGTSLSKEEKFLLFETAHRVAKGKMTLIANTGTNLTDESVFLTKRAKALGMDACLAIVPYYNKPMAEGCLLHFMAIADVGLPVIVYHHPGRTGRKLQLETLVKICSYENIVAVKDATGDFSQATELLYRNQVALYSGDDSLTLPHLAVGFTGCISVVGNIIPKEWKLLLDSFERGNILSAKKKFFSLYELMKAISLEVNPQCIKYALSLMGKCSIKMRLPLTEPKVETQRELERVLGALELIQTVSEKG